MAGLAGPEITPLNVIIQAFQEEVKQCLKPGATIFILLLCLKKEKR